MKNVNKLYELFLERRSARNNNPLYTAEARGKRLNELKTIFPDDPTAPASAEVIQDCINASSQMWKEHAEYEKAELVVQAEINELTNPVEPKVQQVVKDIGGSYSVYIYDEAQDFGAFLWVSYDDKYEDFEVDWAREIFYTDDEDDVAQMLTQENPHIIELYVELAIEAVEKEMNK